MGRHQAWSGRTACVHPSRRRRRGEALTRRGSACLMAVVALATLAAGCGGKSSSSQSTSAADWADGLCSALASWSTSVRAETTSLKGNVTESSLKSASAEVTKATDKLESDLKGLGTPDTESGKKARETLDTLAGQLKTDAQTIDNAGKEVSGTNRELKAVPAVHGQSVTGGAQGR